MPQSGDDPKRLAVRHAAALLYETHGFDQVSIAMIASHARLTRADVVCLFGSSLGILVDIAIDLLNEQARAVRLIDRSVGSPRARLQLIAAELLASDSLAVGLLRALRATDWIRPAALERELGQARLPIKSAIQQLFAAELGVRSNDTFDGPAWAATDRYFHLLNATLLEHIQGKVSRWHLAARFNALAFGEQVELAA